jgi:nicotinamide mononucleotide (NMN) deamidase PncC
MDKAALIAQIHDTPVMAVIAVTGGGAEAVADILAVPGASRTLLEALVPYSEKSLEEFLGTSPTQAVSAETAVALAQTAYQRATTLRENDTVPVIGLACTAALVTDRPKKGDHRTHIGLCTNEQTLVYSITLRKGARDRQGEERVVSDLLLHVCAKGSGLEPEASLALLPEEHLIVEKR